MRDMKVAPPAPPVAPPVAAPVAPPVAAPVAAVAANAVPGYTVAKHRIALTSLKDALHNLGMARDNLATTAGRAKRAHPKLSSTFWKQGNKRHHRTAQRRIDRMADHVYNNLEYISPGITKDLKNAHAAIPAAIDAVRTAHDNLLEHHKPLAKREGKSGAKTRTFINDDGQHFSLGNYHGKKHTDPGDGVTIVKGIDPWGGAYESGAPHNRLFGGGKTRKHRRKHKRKTRKHKTRKRKRKRKTKKRKHHRRKHKRKTRRR